MNPFHLEVNDALLPISRTFLKNDTLISISTNRPDASAPNRNPITTNLSPALPALHLPVQRDQHIHRPIVTWSKAKSFNSLHAHLRRPTAKIPIPCGDRGNHIKDCNFGFVLVQKKTGRNHSGTTCDHPPTSFFFFFIFWLIATLV